MDLKMNESEVLSCGILLSTMINFESCCKYLTSSSKAQSLGIIYF